MASPLIGIAAVNSLLFAAYGTCKRAITPFGELTLPQTAVAGAGAGAINAVLASPVGSAQRVADTNADFSRILRLSSGRLGCRRVVLESRNSEYNINFLCAKYGRAR